MDKPVGERLRLALEVTENMSALKRLIGGWE
jgi:hypothetical protein